MMTYLSMRSLVRWFMTLLVFMCMCSVPAQADFNTVSVIRVEGSVTLRRDANDATVEKGQVLNLGDRLIVPKGSHVDIAYDDKWENVSRLAGPTDVTLQSLNPLKLKVSSGDIFSKMDSIPQGSSFEIATPVAVAAVRGTAFHMVHKDGQTSVFNHSESSLVYIYAVDKDGNPTGDPIILKPGESYSTGEQIQVFENPLDFTEDKNRNSEDELMGELTPDNPPAGDDGYDEGDGYIGGGSYT